MLVVDGTSGLTFNDSSLQGAAASPYVLKNRIINGAMMIDQRNAGASVTPTATGYYSCDRWTPQLTQASKFSVQQQTTTIPTGFSYAQQFSVVSTYSVGASDYFGTEQRIEGFNTADLAWGTANAQTVTLSFWAYANNAGTYCGSLGNSGDTLSYVFTYTLTANTWTKVSITIPGSTSGTWVGATNGIGVVVRFTLSAGSGFQTSTTNSWISGNYAVTSSSFNWIGTASATFYITGVQLEIGTSATPFERRLYNQELANCQRYYQYFGGEANYGYFGGTANITSTTNAFLPILFSVQMRSAPSFTYVGTLNTFDLRSSGNTSHTPTAFAQDQTTSKVFALAITTSGLTANTPGFLIGANSTAGQLCFSAEL